MTIKDILNRLRRKKEYYHEAKMQDRVSEKIEQSKLSSEERALNKILEKKRQEKIKSMLHNHYKEEDNDYWHHDVISQPNIFNDHHDSLLKGQHNLMRQKNMFKTKRRLFA